MNAWGKSSNVGDKVLMLADGNGEYAKALGLELDASGFGMGTRGQRFAIIAQDGVAKHGDIEEKGQFKLSSAGHVLSQRERNVRRNGFANTGGSRRKGRFSFFPRGPFPARLNETCGAICSCTTLATATTAF